MNGFSVKQVTDGILDRLTEEAARTPRRRVNLNLHQSYQDPCQRLFNAVEPGSYIRPHRHLSPPRAEAFIAIRGRLAVITFSDSGGLKEVLIFAPDSPLVGVEIEPGEWHSLVSLEEGSLVFEVKPGPYEPVSDKDWPSWAPAENSREAATYLARLESLAREALPRG